MKLLAPAKINLFLRVTGKRPDGYHDLITLMCCVGLYDTLTISSDTRGITVDCADPDVPGGAANLVYKAASLYFDALAKYRGMKHEGVKIRIDKRIPIGAGLGGGSSDAAAVFLGLNRHYALPFSQDELIRMGLQAGADVPFFIFGRPAVARGVGEEITPFNQLEADTVLLVYPGFSVSTADVYRKLNLGLTKHKKESKEFPFNSHHFEVKGHLCNDLETVTAADYPEVLKVKEALLSQGAKAALMTGSGPTVFGLFSNRKKAERAKAVLVKNRMWKLFLVDMLV